VTLSLNKKQLHQLSDSKLGRS